MQAQQNVSSWTAHQGLKVLVPVFSSMSMKLYYWVLISIIHCGFFVVWIFFLRCYFSGKKHIVFFVLFFNLLGFFLSWREVTVSVFTSRREHFQSPPTLSLWTSVSTSPPAPHAAGKTRAALSWKKPVCSNFFLSYSQFYDHNNSKHETPLKKQQQKKTTHSFDGSNRNFKSHFYSHLVLHINIKQKVRTSVFGRLFLCCASWK